MQGEEGSTRKIGTFRSDLMHFCLMDEPSALEGMMDEILKGLLLARVHVDGSLISLKPLDEDLTDIKTVLDRILECSLKFKLSKLLVATNSTKLLVHVVD